MTRELAEAFGAAGVQAGEGDVDDRDDEQLSTAGTLLVRCVVID